MAETLRLCATGASKINETSQALNIASSVSSVSQTHWRLSAANGQ